MNDKNENKKIWRSLNEVNSSTSITHRAALKSHSETNSHSSNGFTEL